MQGGGADVSSYSDNVSFSTISVYSAEEELIKERSRRMLNDSQVELEYPRHREILRETSPKEVQGRRKTLLRTPVKRRLRLRLRRIAKFK